jgi:hypothetical protein
VSRSLSGRVRPLGDRNDAPPLMNSNPARDGRVIKYETEGFHTWTPEEFAQFEERHPLGAKAYPPLGLLLYTGTRRGMVTWGRQHVSDPSKSEQTKTVVLSEESWLPIWDQIVKASPFLVPEYGKPFTAAGLVAGSYNPTNLHCLPRPERSPKPTNIVSIWTTSDPLANIANMSRSRPTGLGGLSIKTPHEGRST